VVGCKIYILNLINLDDIFRAETIYQLQYFITFVREKFVVCVRATCMALAQWRSTCKLAPFRDPVHALMRALVTAGPLPCVRAAGETKAAPGVAVPAHGPCQDDRGCEQQLFQVQRT
jgi:hypothetical protein